MCCKRLFEKARGGFDAFPGLFFFNPEEEKKMALKLSTGLRNFLMGEGSLRKAFEDGILNIYSGAAPAGADDAATGVLLAKITKASGAVVAGERSTPQIGLITIGSHNPGETFIVNVTVDGAGPTGYTFTNTPDAGGVAEVAMKVAEMLNDIPQLCPVASGSDGNIFVMSRLAGLAFTIANGGGTGTISALTSEVKAASALNSLKLANPASGVIQKNSDVWSGVGLATGTAGYFRLVTTLDTGLLSTTELRIQGNVSTSGAELNLSNINITLGATQTIDTFQLTEPAS
jgi:hypothetical protein